jgi:hypothetical protein
MGGARTPSTERPVSASSCWRASGDAFTRNHGPSPPRIAIDDCVRGRARAPARAASHVGQRQFHCGNPPPAAEPRIRTRTFGRSAAQPQATTGGHASFTVLPVVQVGSDLRAHLDELKLRLNPGHRISPLRVQGLAAHLTHPAQAAEKGFAAWSRRRQTPRSGTLRGVWLLRGARVHGYSRGTLRTMDECRHRTCIGAP